MTDPSASRPTDALAKPPAAAPAPPDPVLIDPILTDPVLIDPVLIDPVPSDAVLQTRRLLHDMNNGLEIIVQAAYLVGTLDLGEDGKQWMKLLEHGVTQVTTLNAQLRDLIRKQELV